MPPRLATRRAVGALVIAAAFSLTAMPGPALALDPPRPLPGYHPTFVTERQAGPWEDCVWAAAAMLLDKWTNGRTIVDRERLRAMSGDLDGGSSLSHVQRAFAKLGLTMDASPIAGDSVTWNELLERLGQGGGAILLGDYGKLPRKYGRRWDPSFWTNEGVLDDHALYLDGYDRQRGLILVMDPLAPAGWEGEWIPVKALKPFAWRGRGGALWTAMTPAALAAPYEGVEFGDSTAVADASSLQVSWPIERAPDGWAYAGAGVTTQITAVENVDRTQVVVAALPTDELAAPPAAPSAAVADASLTASIPLPTPGVYDVSVTLTDDRFGLEVVTGGPFTLYVPGPRAATYVVPDDLKAESEATVYVSVAVRNSGIESWVDPPLDPLRRLEAPPARNTRLVGTWISDAPAKDDERGLPLPPPPIEFGPLALEPDYLQLIESVVRVPAGPGYWHLVVDIVDDEIGSLAHAGSVPGDIVIEVLASGQNGQVK